MEMQKRLNEIELENIFGGGYVVLEDTNPNYNEEERKRILEEIIKQRQNSK